MGSVTTPDPARVASERLMGSETNGTPSTGSSAPEKSSQRGGARAGAGRKKSGASKKEAPPPRVRTQAEIEQGAGVCSFLVATVWDMVAPVMKRRTLKDDEAQAVGAALDPVLEKYLPAMGDWALELNLLLVVATVWSTTALPKGDGSGELKKDTVRKLDAVLAQ